MKRGAPQGPLRHVDSSYRGCRESFASVRTGEHMPHLPVSENGSTGKSFSLDPNSRCALLSSTSKLPPPPPTPSSNSRGRIYLHVNIQAKTLNNGQFQIASTAVPHIRVCCQQGRTSASPRSDPFNASCTCLVASILLSNKA